MENFNTKVIVDMALEYGIPVLKAIVIYLIGSFLIKKVLKVSKKVMQKRDYDETLQKFLLNLMKWVLIILLLVTVIGTLGIQTTGLAAVLASVGLAIGLALQGSLSNFAGGVLILIFKHFKVGDFIDAQGVLGTVKSVDILNTKLITPQNKLAIIPNGPLANGNIINFSSEGILRVDATIGVGYSSDIPKTIAALKELASSHPLVLKEPAPVVAVIENADSSINICVRPYTLTADYWTVFFHLQENFVSKLDAIGVEVPFPQRVVHQAPVQAQA